MEKEGTYEMVEETKTSTATVIISFLLGGVVGSLITFHVTRKKLREEMESEIADVTDYYNGRVDALNHILVESIPSPVEDDHPRDDLPPEDKPYPISQQEYVEEMDFHKETVIYYEKDDILTDGMDRDIEIDSTIGREALSHFGDDEEDIAYARNDKIGTDYEIVLEHKSFAAVVGEDVGD